MTELNEIINDLNITIADTETFGARITSNLKTKPITDAIKRAVGQLKAARASLIVADRLSNTSQVSQVNKEVNNGPR